MIELDDDWVSCHDKSGNRAYFPYDNIHPDYTQDGYVLVTAKEFLDYYDCVDSTYDDSYFQTYDYFKQLHTGKEIEFEDIHISKDALQDMAINALLNDNYRCQVFNRSYDEWEFITSLDTVMDDHFYCDYTVDHILKEMKLPDLYTLQADFLTDDIQFEDENNPYPIMKK
ncbi:hypothetical protein HPMBJEAJ_00094 [Aeromonas phage avDM6]|nr:hypothetical protein HPMBJEAJ_00094 [Aeromonas phage avDM6]